MLAYDWNFLGLSTETKPLSGEKVVDGSTYYECDTSLFFIYYNGKWYQQTFVTEDGINFWLYKALMKKMFGKWFDSNISLAKVIKPTAGTEIEFTNSLPAQITDLTGYGNTFQQTYSGKNLIDNTDVTYDYSNVPSSNNHLSTLPTGIRYMTTYSGSGSPIVVFKLPIDLTQYTGKTVRLMANFGLKGRLVLVRVNSDATSRTSLATTDTSGEVLSWVVPESLGDNHFLGFNLTVNMPGGEYQVDFTNLILTIDNPDMTYEPYVGGTASPNPDYPQDIQTVTGEQTVTINGEQVYPIDLGTIELCKIGNYQDYIYKSGDDWYVHKEVVKISPNGTEEWKTTSTQPPTGQFYVYTTDFDSIVKTKWYSGLVSDNFTMWVGTPSWLTPTTIVNGAVFSNSDSSGAAALRIMFPSSIVSNVETAKTWFASNLPVFYYPLATPTDTKITDSTLISNLNSLLNYIFPAGDHQLVITADTLPMALKLTITEKE